MAPMCTITLARTMSFSTYNHSKHAMASWVHSTTGFNVFEHTHTKGSYPNLYTIGCFGVAGAVSGAALSIFACPFELSKICTQVSVQLLSDPLFKDDAKRQSIAASYQHKGPFKCMGAIVRNRGAAGLYTGLGIHLSELFVLKILLELYHMLMHKHCSPGRCRHSPILFDI